VIVNCPRKKELFLESAGGTALASEERMALCIEHVPEASASNDLYSSGSSALDLAGRPELTLRFAIEAENPEDLEALRHARRSMLREELTRGRDGQRPSLEDAIFSAAEISWRIPPEERRWCLKKVEELVERATRTLAELRMR
jgi:hypothetical protein